MRHPWKLPLAVVCLLALAFFPLLPARRGAAQTAAYTVTDVGTLTGTDGTSTGLGLDECGRVVGESIPTGSSSNHPYFWDGAQLTDIGTFGGLVGTAAAVNNAGAVTGSAHSGTSQTRPFIWTTAAGKTDIATVPPPPNAGNAAAYDINESNQVVGQWEISPLHDRGYAWTPATATHIITATWGTPIAAYGVNNAGQIVGTAETSTGAAHAFIRSGGVTTEIGTLGGTNSFAYEVNESGVVVGYANIPSTGASRPFHAFRWTSALGSTPQDLGTLGGGRSIAYGVNASGQIVGYAEVSAGVNHAFLWSDDNSNGAPDAGELKDLNTLLPGTGWTFQEARAINDRGQIVGTGVNPSGQTHAFLLTPSNVGASPCDPPGSLQFDSATYTVGEAGTTATITVTRTGGSYGAVSVGYATSNGTAAAGSDYTATSGTLNFATDETSKTFNVTIAEDALNEANETVNLTLSSPAGGATLGSPSAAVLTINDNDTAPSLSIGDMTVTEGNSGTVNAVFNVTLAAASGQTVTVNYATADNSATQPGDYTSTSGTLTFNPGETSKTITVAVVGDTADEPNETFFVNLSATTNATVSHGQGVGTINDDDGIPALSVADATAVTEGNAGTTPATFTVSLLPASGQTVTVNYATADGTATSASGDYTAISSTQLTFNPGETSKSVTVNVNGDTTPEANENFFVTLTSPSNATVSDNQGQGTVNNDDTALTINDLTIAEGNSGSTAFNFTVSLSHVSVNAVLVNYATSNGTATAGSDYAAASGTVNIPAGGTSGTVSVNVTGETTFEADETFNVTLSGASAGVSISDNTGVGTITNDDTAPAFSINDVSVAEGNAGTTAATFTVSLSAASGLASSVNYATADNTATTASGDYAATSGTLNFAAGETSKTVNVNVNGDTVFEGNEAFFVNLTSPSGATVADAQGLGTITNDEAGSVFKFDSNPSSVSEAASSVTITVTRTGSTASGASVNYAASGGSATAGSDYTLTSGTLTFAAGETSKTFNVSLLQDTLFEGNETVGLALSSPVAGTLGTPATISLTIIDANTRPTLQFSATAYTVGENGGTATITVVRSGGSNGGVTVNYATSNGTAAAGSDYTATSGTLTFAADDNSETFTVAVAEDALDEANETINLTLSNPGGNGQLGPNTSATLTITDNDGAPTLSVADVTAVEGQGAANFNVTLSAPSGQTVTVNYSTSNGTAVEPGDYAAVNSGTVTFSPGETSKPAAVTVVNDALDEADENFSVTLSGATNASISDNQGVGTITDDDEPPVLSVGDVTVVEGSGGATNAVFAVTLSGASSRTVTINYATADNTAAAGADYTAANGTLTFNPGETSKNVTVNVVGDTVDEPNETFFVNLLTPLNATVSDGQGVGTINDDDGSPSLSVGDVTMTEGNSGTVNAVFNVTLAPASGQAVSVNYATADGTAAAGSDYTAASGTLNFAVGETSKTVTVQVSGDTSNEGNETFFVNLSGAANATVSDAQGLGTIQNDDTPLFAFAQPSFPTSEGAHFVTVSVTRSGDSSGAVNVNFATSDGAATERKDYTAVSGTLRFAAGETSKSFDVLLTDDAFQELDETINLTLSNPTGGAALGTQATASVVIAADDNPPPASNPIDASSDFVRQHYHDFLNREPDAPGLAFWTAEIESCGSNAACREVKRINVSAAFFLSIEFQETGYLVYRAYKTAYGDATSPGVAGTVPVVRLGEFLTDTRRIGEGVVVGQGEWKRQLDSNKIEYFIEFTQRPRFLSEYPLSMGLTEYLNKLAQNAGVVLTGEDYERAAAYVRLGPDQLARALILQMIAEKEALQQQELRRAFVLMQYYGYLRRNPDDAPEPGLNFGGWNFWLGKLNEFNGDFVRAEMVKAFITSTEYRQRFGQ